MLAADEARFLPYAPAFADEPGRADKLGIVVGDRLIAASSLGPRMPTTMTALLARAPESLVELRQALDAAGTGTASDAGIPLDQVEPLAPVPRPGS